MEARSVPSEVKKGLYRAFVRVGAGLIDYRTRSCDALLQHWVKVCIRLSICLDLFDIFEIFFFPF